MMEKMVSLGFSKYICGTQTSKSLRYLRLSVVDLGIIIFKTIDFDFKVLRFGHSIRQNPLLLGDYKGLDFQVYTLRTNS